MRDPEQFTPVDLTELMQKELTDLAEQQATNTNLALALRIIIDATTKPAMVLTETMIRRQMSTMSRQEIEEQLLLGIKAFRRVARAGASMMIVAAEQRREARKSNAKNAAANSNRLKRDAMNKIRERWNELQGPGARYPGDAAFAKDAHAAYSDVIDNEGSIKNAITRWRKEKSSS